MKLIHVTKNNSKVYRLKDNRIGIIYDSGYVRVSKKLNKKYNDYKFQMKFTRIDKKRFNTFYNRLKNKSNDKSKKSKIR